MYLGWMGCCGSIPEIEPLLAPDDDQSEPDPVEVKFNAMYMKGCPSDMIPTREVALSMGLPVNIMGRLVKQWGYELGRRYLDGKRDRVVIGIKVRPRVDNQVI